MQTRVLRVLVADDEKSVADSLVMILNSSGYEATAVYSGESAVEAVLRQIPDVLISDVIMEKMTGIEAAGEVLKIAPECRVLLLSGQITTSDLLKDAENLGYHFEILPKPIHPSVLLEYLDKYA
jgi:CheY-like chemotaxis protein